MNTASVGRTVQWARKRAGMTQHELAHAMHVPQPTIARIERGTVAPRTATLIAMLEATGHELAVEPIDRDVDVDGIHRRLALAVPTRIRSALGRTSRNARTRPTWILRRLRRFGVPFVLIGELAEVTHGSPAQVGRVVEIVHAKTDVARERLALALDDLHSMTTDAGSLRVFTETAAGDDYNTLLRNAVQTLVDTGLLVRVAAIEDLIRVRLAGCAPEDRKAAAVLRAIAQRS